VILRNNNTNEFVIRVYNVGRKTVAEFYSIKDDERYQVKVSATNFDNISVLNKTTGKPVLFGRNEAFIQFPIMEGDNYEVK
jgi:hypothetical protein